MVQVTGGMCLLEAIKHTVHCKRLNRGTNSDSIDVMKNGLYDDGHFRLFSL
jgi:hypothetical protein